MLVCRRRDGAVFHQRVEQLPSWLNPGDLLIVNDTRVRRARLKGRRLPGGGAAEFLLLRRAETDSMDGGGTAPRQRAEVWECMARPGRRLKEGTLIAFSGGLEGKIVGRTPAGRRLLELTSPDGEPPAEHIRRAGELPLPPYIDTPLDDEDRYQTMFAREEGSVAAPTAGLHFTPHLMEKLAEAGVNVGRLTLHVGPGTFLPLQGDTVAEHRLEGEYVHVPDDLAEQVRETRRRRGRVVAVGTTVVRTLEYVGRDDGTIGPYAGFVDLFITPGYTFKVVDALLTNFHLPRSSLLVLVAAFAGTEKVLDVYSQAIQAGYRFYSLGDATLWL